MVGVTAPYQTDHTNPRNKNTEQDSVIRSGGYFCKIRICEKTIVTTPVSFAKETVERAKKQQGLPQYAPDQQLIPRPYSEQGNLL